MAVQKKSGYQKADYYVNRAKEPKLTKNKKMYASFWVEGYNQQYIENNLPVAQKEMKEKKLDIVGLSGFINGAKARVKEQELKSKKVNRKK